MAENRAKMKQIPAFTVLKNGSILKNIFLLHKSSVQEPDSSDDEQILLVGRHPNCNITLEHPSISRHHLRIHSNPSSHSLYVVDLSSVHGTWVSGNKIEPWVNVTLKEGDTVKLGSSSRVYVLHWVPASEAYDHNGKFVPAISTIKEGEDETNQDEKLETRSWDDDLESLDMSLCSKCHDSDVTKLNLLTFSGQNYLNSVCDDVEVEQLSTSRTGNQNDETLGTVSVKSPSVVSGAKSVIDQLDCLSDDLGNEFEMVSHVSNKDDPYWEPSYSNSSCDDTETFGTVSLKSPSFVLGTKSVIDQLDWLNDNLGNEFEMLSYGTNKDDMFWAPSCSKSSCTDPEIEHSSNQNDDIFAKISVQSPLVVPKSIPAREIFCGLNESENQLNWLEDDVKNEFELQNQGITNENVFSVANCLSSSCDDTNIEQLSPSKMGNATGEILSTMLVEPSLTSDTISRMEESNSLKKSVDPLDWLKDNLSNEFELPNYKAINEGPSSVAKCSTPSSDDTELDCSSPWKTGYEKVDTFATVPVQSSLVVPESIPETECTDSQKTLSDQLHWLKDNMSSEFELQNQAIMKQDVLSGADSSSSSSDDHEIMKKESVLVVPPAETGKDQKQAITPETAKAKEVPMNLEALKNESVLMNLLDSLDGNEFEIFTPGKENKDPNPYTVKSSKKIWMEDEHKISSRNRLSKTAVRTLNVAEEKDIFSFSAETKNVFLQRSLNDKYMVDQLVYYDETLISTPEKETELRQGEMKGSFNSINFPQTVQKAVIDPSNNIIRGPKEKWAMIVDTGSLLNAESLKYLTLLKGLKGTQLVIPKAVIRELVDIEIQDTFFKTSTKKATSALKWIEELMGIAIQDTFLKMNTKKATSALKWIEELVGIEIQDTFLKTSTEKATSALKWIEECIVSKRWWIHMDDEILLSSEAESHVLETALLLSKEITDQKVIILSNDLNIKIKAMAEGVMCEAAKEFHRSLVNPFSERFMWAGSSARGLTWSSIDDDVLRENYYGCSLNGPHMLKGLKLLAHVTTLQSEVQSAG